MEHITDDQLARMYQECKAGIGGISEIWIVDLDTDTEDADFEVTSSVIRGKPGNVADPRLLTEGNASQPPEREATDLPGSSNVTIKTNINMNNYQLPDDDEIEDEDIEVEVEDDLDEDLKDEEELEDEFEEDDEDDDDDEDED